jgi:hypothetical protein
MKAAAVSPGNPGSINPADRPAPDPDFRRTRSRLAVASGLEQDRSGR